MDIIDRFKEAQKNMKYSYSAISDFTGYDIDTIWGVLNWRKPLDRPLYEALCDVFEIQPTSSKGLPKILRNSADKCSQNIKVPVEEVEKLKREKGAFQHKSADMREEYNINDLHPVKNPYTSKQDAETLTELERVKKELKDLKDKMALSDEETKKQIQEAYKAGVQAGLEKIPQMQTSHNKDMIDIICSEYDDKLAHLEEKLNYCRSEYARLYKFISSKLSMLDSVINVEFLFRKNSLDEEGFEPKI